uniref:non-specific serine/threonine protein kinase n=1 Tax=Aceria tosichella TaxID=561515 RepID=A0A6G1S3L2_9ACAR
MEEPNFSRASPRRFITMTMQDKYMAVCFIYDRVQYQNLCRYENPDGTFNISKNCLAKLPHHTNPFIEALEDSNSSPASSSESALIKYGDRSQSPMPPLNAFVSHYWLQMSMAALIISLLTILLVYFMTAIFTNRKKGPRTARVDNSGTISLGKISFHPDEVLGVGSKGTFVYRGSFEGSQDCAVKRVVSQCLTLADREVDFLRSLQHPNLVRYLATEIDPQFIYIALELAEYTLRSVVENEKLDEVDLSLQELCRQSAMGLEHLHQLDIVHRDIKPENILISFCKRPYNKRSVMISDFGLSKQLDNYDTHGHSSSVLRYFDGTQGWMAPEIIEAKLEGKNLAPSKAADIFSLGNVFYYIFFGGRHPFGEKVESRQFNIKENRNVFNEFSMSDNLRPLTAEVILCNHLVGSMIAPQPENRPPISSVLKFPLFLSKDRQLQFLSDVSDWLDQDKGFTSIEKNRRKVFGFDWKQSLTTSLLDDIEGRNGTKHRGYRGHKLQDLLRVIRNKRNHYNDCSDELKSDLGHMPDQFLEYFNSRFPELILHVYKAFQIHRRNINFKNYYNQDDDYYFKELDEIHCLSRN